MPSSRLFQGRTWKTWAFLVGPWFFQSPPDVVAPRARIGPRPGQPRLAWRLFTDGYGLGPLRLGPGRTSGQAWPVSLCPRPWHMPRGRQGFHGGPWASMPGQGFWPPVYTAFLKPQRSKTMKADGIQFTKNMARWVSTGSLVVVDA